MPRISGFVTRYNLLRQTGENEAAEPVQAAPVVILGKMRKSTANLYRLSTEKLSFNFIFYTQTILAIGDVIQELSGATAQTVTADFGNGKYGLS